MYRIAAAVFFVLHGLVHLWYVGLSNNWVEVEDAMGWNGHSWLLSPVLPSGTILSLASGLYILVTIGFVAGAVGIWLDEERATALLASAALLSTAVIVVMWDGRPDLLVEKGILGILFDIGIHVYLFRYLGKVLAWFPGIDDEVSRVIPQISRDILCIKDFLSIPSVRLGGVHRDLSFN